MKTSPLKENRITYFYTTLPSPVGELKLIATDRGLAAILWEKDDPKRIRMASLVENKNHPVLRAAALELREYFAGTRTSFSIPFDPAGTEFQRKVWDALSEIPFGETRSYKDIAMRVGNPAAVRAVGAANGKNPLSIMVPCHRVIGSSGALTGFAGGLGIKSQLLALEARGREEKAEESKLTASASAGSR